MGSAGALARTTGNAGALARIAGCISWVAGEVARAPVFYSVVIGGRPTVGGWSVSKAGFNGISVDILDGSLQVVLVANIAVIVFWHPEKAIAA